MSSFPPLSNDLLLRAARQEPTPRAPVWMMRQAGRYLPEYQAVRSTYEFFDVVRTPALAAEVTLQPVERFPIDAAIIFSDILVIPQVLGLEVQMVKGKGPHFPDPLAEPADLSRLRTPDPATDLGYVLEALTLTRQRLNGRCPLIGFSGAPWTLMAYSIEGGGSKNFSASKRWLYRYPEASHELLQRITATVIDYLDHQIQAGAQYVQVFDSWAGLLPQPLFETFALPYLAEIAAALAERHPDVPRVVFAKGAHYALDALADTAYSVISLDWTMDPAEARATVGSRVALQGNLDPCALYAEPDDIQAQVRRMLDGFGPAGHIANLGHGMHPDHDPAHAGAFIDAVHSVSEELRAADTPTDT